MNRKVVYKANYFGDWLETRPLAFAEKFDATRLPNPAAIGFVLGNRLAVVPAGLGGDGGPILESYRENYYGDVLYQIESHLREEFRRSLFIFGPTGSGKTRVVYELIRRYFRPDGIFNEDGAIDDAWESHDYHPMVGAAELLGEVSALRGVGLDGWLDRWSCPYGQPLLVIDDLGHRLTGAQAEGLLELLRRRLEGHGAHRGDEPVTVVTSQFSPEVLAARWGKAEASETLAAVSRRIREFMLGVDLGPSRRRASR